ncbi:hypothetical protein [Demequina sp. NBRC 110051]|uniref:hypothetical protein n=1 Tax=Demequina sp. NBRC 110051 TaxID=1570340 RepID=UPI000A079107|nr:hypothetical protein [Demequina sp. NBRC 110051]
MQMVNPKSARRVHLRGVRARMRVTLIALGIGGATVIAAVAITTPEYQSLMVVAVIAALGAILAVLHPGTALPVAVVFGLSAGITRRILQYFLVGDELISYLVLVPALMIVIAGVSLRDDGPTAPQNATRVHAPAFFLMFVAVFVLAGVNPAGAGIVNNLLTSALYLAGMSVFMPYFRGQVVLKPLLTAVLVTAALNSAYLIWHEVMGVPAWDLAWAEQGGYASLYLGPGLIRPLGIASSVAESATLAGIGTIIAFWRLKNRRGLVHLVLGLLCAYGLLVTGIRTTTIMLLIAAIALMAAGRRHPLFFAAASGLLVAPVVYLAAGHFSATSDAAGVARITTTLSGQESAETSTLPIHLELMWSSLASGARSVVGTGSGQIGLLASDGLGSADTDLGNAALVGGVLGVVALLVAWWTCARGFSAVFADGGDGAIALLVLIVTFTQWITPNQYGTVPIIWACLGVFARSIVQMRSDASAAVEQRGRLVRSHVGSSRQQARVRSLRAYRGRGNI